MASITNGQKRELENHMFESLRKQNYSLEK